jgi:hypothetical protein
MLQRPPAPPRFCRPCNPVRVVPQGYQDGKPLTLLCWRDMKWPGFRLANGQLGGVRLTTPGGALEIESAACWGTWHRALEMELLRNDAVPRSIASTFSVHSSRLSTAVSTTSSAFNGSSRRNTP